MKSLLFNVLLLSMVLTSPVSAMKKSDEIKQSSCCLFACLKKIFCCCFCCCSSDEESEPLIKTPNTRLIQNAIEEGPPVEEMQQRSPSFSLANSPELQPDANPTTTSDTTRRPMQPAANNTNTENKVEESFAAF